MQEVVYGLGCGFRRLGFRAQGSGLDGCSGFTCRR